MNGLLDSHWFVHESGYEIVQAGEGHVVRPIDPNSRVITYKFDDHPGIFYAFANILYETASKLNLYLYDEENLKKIIATYSDYGYENNALINFVNKYGLLSFENGLAQPIDAIINDILHVSTSTMVLDKLSSLSGQGKRLNEIGEGLKKVLIDVIPSLHEQQAFNFNGQQFNYHFLCSLISEKIKDSITVKLKVNKFNTGFEMEMIPKDLRSAIYLQLAHAITGNLEFKQCIECSTFFEVKTKKRKNERIYCSDRCRVRANARRRRAQEKQS